MTPTSPPREHTRRRPIPIVVIAAVTALVTVSFAVADNPPVPAVGGAAAAYVPPEGYVSWSRQTGDGPDIRRVIEHARSTGVGELLALPERQRSFALEAIGDNARTTQFWREATHTLDGSDTRQLTDLYTITDAGVALVAANGGDLGWVYDPPMVQLPANIAPGVSWEGRGGAIPLGTARYEQSAHAVVPSDPQLLATAEHIDVDVSECVQVNSRVVLVDEAGSEVLTLDQRELWCAARGRVASTVEYDGTTTHYAAVTPHAAPVGVATTAGESSWAAIDSWLAEEVPLVRDDAFFGSSSVYVGIADAPRVTAAGLIVAATTGTNDLIAFSTENEALVQRWAAHPGGAIVAFAAVGDASVVSTSLREIVAYDADGNRLWHSQARELVVAPPTATGDGRVVTVGLDGTVTLLDALTGEKEWTQALGADVEVSAAVAGDIVAVIDRAGNMTALDAATGDVAWTRPAGPAAALRAFGALLITVGDDGWMRSFEVASGEPAHSWRFPGSWRALLPAGGAAVLVTDEVMIAVDPATGAELWRAAGADGAAGDGDVVVALRGSAATATDARGETVAQWQVPASFTWSNQFAVVTARALVLMRSGSEATIVGPR